LLVHKGALGTAMGDDDDDMNETNGWAFFGK